MPLCFAGNTKIMIPCERSGHKEYTHMQYESPISSGKKVIMVKVKVFVHASNADTDADTSAMTLAAP